jgi:hypothetical protein
MPGDFPCDVQRLRSRLPHETDLILGRIEEMLPGWLEGFAGPPVGFVSVDVDLYSPTAAICEAFGSAHIGRLLPFVSFYFDDLLRYLTPRATGELAAIAEFNRSHFDRQFDRDDWLCEDRPFGERLWLKRMYSLCCFDHPVMQSHQDREAARLDLVVR